MRRFFFISVLSLLLAQTTVVAQDQSIDYPPVEINIDSIIQDSLSKAFILNHRPLSEKELTSVVIKKEASTYGSYIKYYMQHVGWYSLKIPQGALYSPKRVRPNLEWIFYSFLFLFLFTAVLGKYSNGLLRKLWKIYVNDGFIHRQSKDQMSQQPVVSIALNVLFIFSAGLFVFFGLGWDHEFSGNMRWFILVASFVAIGFVYLFKHILFTILGWAFGQEQAFDDYLFVVFLNNKLWGLVFLFSSFVMAFSDTSTSNITFRLTLFLAALMLLYRLIRGYQVFSKQSKIGLFTLLIAFIALELIPSAVFVKFLSTTIELYFTGIA
ncbi:MAG: hypothetical protein RLZZ520_1372 [Bacteroidota bacterium]|jgi:hypothetical protein